jgi:hypothetical protein
MHRKHRNWTVAGLAALALTLVISTGSAKADGPRRYSDHGDRHSRYDTHDYGRSNSHRGHSSYGRSHAYGHYDRHAHHHDRGHWDYHPGYYQRHGDHYDYVPGHYHYHRGGHHGHYR